MTTFISGTPADPGAGIFAPFNTADANRINKQSGWGKAAREVKQSWLQDQLDRIMGAGLSESKRLQGEGEARGQRMEDILAAALPNANGSTWTDAAFNQALGAGTDAGAQDYLHGMDSLRTSLGGAGVTGGGMAAGLATGMELGRLGQITDSRRSLFIQRSMQDAADKARAFQNTLTYANVVGRSPETVYMNFLGDAANMTGQRLGAEQTRSAAKDAANATKSAGYVNAASSLFSALL